MARAERATRGELRGVPLVGNSKFVVLLLACLSCTCFAANPMILPLAPPVKDAVGADIASIPVFSDCMDLPHMLPLITI